MKHIFYPLALLAGAALVLAFAPIGFYPLAFLSPAILLFLWSKGSIKENALLGFLFGLGFFALGASWVFISIHQYGNASSLLAGLITFLFIITLALFFTLFAAVFTYIFPKNNLCKLLLAFPLLWVLFEALRGVLFTGFPWLFLGYSQIDSPLGNFAPVIGVYGISLLTVFCSAILASFFIYQNKKLLLLPVLLLVTIFYGAFKINNYHWTTVSKNPISVAIIQGNIRQELKWRPENVLPILNHYQALSFMLKGQKIIFWPEGAITIFPSEINNYVNKISQMAQKNHSTIIAGAPLADFQTQSYYNGLIALGEYPGKYLKRHLVPFGEYTPLKNIFGNALGFLGIPMSNFFTRPDVAASFKNW